MKHVLLIFFLLAAVTGLGQQAHLNSDSLKKVFKWKALQARLFEITVPGYDSLRLSDNSFQDFYYATADKADGTLLVKDQNGKKRREAVYKNYKMLKETWWYANAAREFEGTWSEVTDEYHNQHLIEYTWYYENKKLKKKGYYTGITSSYDKDGKLEKEKQYRDGKAFGMYKEYYPDGKLKVEGAFHDNVKTGDWKYYNPDGSLQQQ